MSTDTNVARVYPMVGERVEALVVPGFPEHNGLVVTVTSVHEATEQVYADFPASSGGGVNSLYFTSWYTPGMTKVYPEVGDMIVALSVAGGADLNGETAKVTRINEDQGGLYADFFFTTGGVRGNFFVTVWEPVPDLTEPSVDPKGMPNVGDRLVAVTVTGYPEFSGVEFTVGYVGDETVSGYFDPPSGYRNYLIVSEWGPVAPIVEPKIMPNVGDRLVALEVAGEPGLAGLQFIVSNVEDDFVYGNFPRPDGGMSLRRIERWEPIPAPVAKVLPSVGDQVIALDVPGFESLNGTIIVVDRVDAARVWGVFPDDPSGAREDNHLYTRSWDTSPQLQSEIDSLKATLARSREAYSELFEQTSTDMSTLSDELLSQASARSWCEEFDALTRKVNDNMVGPHRLEERSADYSVTWTVTVSIDVPMSMTVNARNADDAIEDAQEQDGGPTDADIEDAIRNGASWDCGSSDEWEAETE